MTSASERDRARHVVVTTARLRDELKVGIEEAQGRGALTPERLARLTAPERTVLLAFLKRFENAVEAGRRVFRAALAAIAVDVADMSTFDILDAAEREAALASAAGWRDVMRARNVIVHEYSMAPAEAAAALANALVAAQAAAELLDGALLAITRPPFTRWLGEPAT